LGAFANLELKPTFQLKVDVSSSFTIKYTNTSKFGFTYDSVNGFSESSSDDYNDENITVTGKLEASLFVGIKLSPSIEDKLGGKFIKVEFSGLLGVNFKASLSFTAKLGENGSVSIDSDIIQNDGSIDSNTMHSCDWCIDGDIEVVFKISFTVKLFPSLKALKLEYGTTIINVTFKVADFYLSSETGFDFGTCTNIMYKTKFTIVDENGAALTDVSIKMNDHAFNVNDNGVVQLYCKNGAYSFVVNNAGGEAVYSNTIAVHNSAKSYTIVVDPEGNVDIGEPDEIIITTTATTRTTTTTTTKATVAPVPDVYIIESGQLGDNIYYMLYNDGYMWIYGYGAMYDFSSSPYDNTEFVKEVLIESIDDEQTITNIGAHVFDGCMNLSLIEMPDTITAVGDYAFSECTSLTEVTLPDSLNSLGKNVFYKCYLLKELKLPYAATSRADALVGASFNEYGQISDIFESSSHYNGSYLSENYIIETITITGGETIPDYAFYGIRSLKKIILKGETIKSLGDYAFYLCTSLESIEISDSVTMMGAYVFYNTGFSELPGGNNLTRIGDYAFSNCANLVNVEIPSTYKEVGDSAFSNCTNLTYIEMPDTITAVGDYAFANCSLLETMPMNGNLTSIGSYAFQNCTSFTEATIGSKVETIGGFAFTGCTGLTEITIPGNVKTIGNYAFSGCSGITTATIYDGVESIGSYLFNGCTSLESLTLPFAGFDLNEVEENTKKCIAGLFCNSEKDDTYSSGFDSYQYIPNSLTRIVVTGGSCIPSGAFYGMSSLTEIILPDNILFIGDKAFSNCNGITTLDIPDRVTSIGNYAFNECTGLVDLRMPDSLESIGDYAFNKCSGLKGIYLADSLLSIGEYAFYMCTGLESMDIPDNITSIKTYTFYRCSSLSNINLPANLNTIGDYAFYACENLTDLILPDCVISIGQYAFKLCTNLKNVKMSSALTSIGEYAFQFCSSIIEMTIPKGVTEVSDYAFEGCSSIGELLIEDGVNTIGAFAFYKCSSITDVEMPHSVTSIETHAFSYCSSLESITIPNPECVIFGGRETILNGYESGINGTGYYYNGIIYGSTKSYIQTYVSAYAESHGYNFVSIDEEEYNTDGWRVKIGEAGVMKLTKEGDAYEVTLRDNGGRDSGGEDRYDCQFIHDNITLQGGHTYRLAYAVKSDQSGYMYSTITDGYSSEYWHSDGYALTLDLSDEILSEDELITQLINASPTGPYIGYYQGWDQWKNEPITADTWVTRAYEFTPESYYTDDNAFWTFHLGGSGQYTSFDCFPNGTTLQFKNIVLIDVTEQSGNLVQSGVEDKEEIVPTTTPETTTATQTTTTTTTTTTKTTTNITTTTYEYQPISWVVEGPSECPYAGETATYYVYVMNENGIPSLPIAGAQFSVAVDSPLEVIDVVVGDAYTGEINKNESLGIYSFTTADGTGCAAHDFATAFEISVFIPSDTEEGDYNVTLSDLIVYDEFGNDISDMVTVEGWDVYVMEAPEELAIDSMPSVIYTDSHELIYMNQDIYDAVSNNTDILDVGFVNYNSFVYINTYSAGTATITFTDFYGRVKDIEITVVNPENAELDTVYTGSVFKLNGEVSLAYKKYVFTAQEDGNYEFCISSKSTYEAYDSTYNSCLFMNIEYEDELSQFSTTEFDNSVYAEYELNAGESVFIEITDGSYIDYVDFEFLVSKKEKTTITTTTSTTTTATSTTTDSSTTSTTTTTTTITTTTSSTTSTSTSTTTSVTTTMPTTTTPEVAVLFGDVDSDGAVNASDASQVLAEYAIIATGGIPTFSEEQTKAADVNADGATDAIDASSILGYYAYIATGGSGTIEEYLN